MSIIQLLFINFLSYVFLYKISFLITTKYIYPFRIADLINLFLNSIIFSTITWFNFSFNWAVITLFINFNLFYISYSVVNLINTSPRMKIILEIYNNKKIPLNELYNYYNYENILENRINRLLSSNQIEIKDSYVSLKKTNFSFFTLVIFIMNFLKKF